MAHRSASNDEMGWDDEELDTQIFEKDGEPEVLGSRDIFEDDDDRTVANEPPPDILRAATAPNLATPQPRFMGRGDAATSPGSRMPTPPPGGRLPGPPSGAPKTLFGMPAPNPSGFALPPPPAPGRPMGSPTPPPGAGRRHTRSSMSIPAAPALPPSFFAPRSESFDVPITAGPGGSSSRAKTFTILGFLALVVLGGGAGAYYWSLNRAGKVEINVVPPDATILVDNVKVADRSPFTLEKPPGPYTVSVVRPGYTRNDQSVEVRAGQTAALSVALEAAADTGFELTSIPPGGLVWLDGNAMSGPDGQARTDFRAYRIPPGKHVLEIKGDPKRQPWREEIQVEPGLIKKVNAILAPIGSEAAKIPPPAPPPSGGPHVVPPPSAGKTEPGPSTAPTPRPRRPRPPREDTEEEPIASRPRTPPSAGEESTGGGGGDCAITVGTRPWSEVWIDGKNTGRHTPYSESISCGKHKLTFKRPDLSLTRTESITVRSGEKFKQSFSLESE